MRVVGSARVEGPLHQHATHLRRYKKKTTSKTALATDATGACITPTNPGLLTDMYRYIIHISMLYYDLSHLVA